MPTRLDILNLLREKLKTSALKTDNDLLTILSEQELMFYLFRNKPVNNNSMRLTGSGKEIFKRFFKLWEIDITLVEKPSVNHNTSWTLLTALNTHELLILNRYLKSPWFYDHHAANKLWLSGDDEVSYLKLMDGNMKDFITFCSNSLDS